MAREGPAAQWRSEVRTAAPWQAGGGAAALPKTRRRLARIFAEEPLRRNSRGRDGTRKNPPDARLFEDGRGTKNRKGSIVDCLPHVAGLQLGGRGREIHAGVEGPGL